MVTPGLRLFVSTADDNPIRQPFALARARSLKPCFERGSEILDVANGHSSEAWLRTTFPCGGALPRTFIRHGNDLADDGCRGHPAVGLADVVADEKAVLARV